MMLQEAGHILGLGHPDKIQPATFIRSTAPSEAVMFPTGSNHHLSAPCGPNPWALMVPGVPDGVELDPRTGVRPAAMATMQLGNGNRYRCLQPDDLEGLNAFYPPECTGAHAPGVTPTIVCPTFEHEAEFVSGSPQMRMVCLDTCDTAGDAVCQDGGSGGTYNTCELGTDCTDCGTRRVAIASSSGERSKGLQALMYVLTGLLGLFGLTLFVLLVVSCFTKEAEPQPTRAGMPNVDGTAGWGPFGFLFPKSWVYVWWGYLAMVLFSAVILPSISEALAPNVSTGMVTQLETIETILSVGPFIHCFLMPFLWTHKHREVKKRIDNQGTADVVVASELDPEAKTVIFSMKLGCGQRCTVLLADLTMGLVEFVLWAVKRGSLGTINLSAFWFPSPFYTFWKAKMHIGLIQIDGAKICTTANQGDAYMKFCTEAMLNFWTLGIYGLCCGKRTSYGRWLDRHVLWQGAPPSGYTNRELAPLFSSAPSAPPPRLAPTPPRSHLDRVPYLRREARLLRPRQGLPPWAAARPTWWFPLDDPVYCTSSNITVDQPTLLLTCSAAFRRRIVGGLWPFGLVLPWYLYTVKLANMKFGGADPTFVEEFTWCNYIIKYYTIGFCGLCGQPVKVWVDTCIVMGEPKFDQDMANRDSQADSANPNELSQRFSNQSASRAQTVSVQVHQGLQGGMPMTELATVPQQVEVIVSQQGKRWLGTPAASTGAKGDEAANEGGGTQKAAAPQSLVALLAACGLEHRSKAFEDEEYTLENLLAAFKSGQAVAKGDLRELKLTLGECRQILNQLEATAA